MFGIIDCNNFFVSCERVFNPALAGIPVVVLSNNDGCAVALSNEAKSLGLKRGDPYFKIKDICADNGVAVFSGNHKLYGDMSRRVMSVLSEHVRHLEIYSIDEAFFISSQLAGAELTDYGRSIVTRVRRCTGIPTSIGFAPTKTLAKMATRFAKKYPAYRCCCAIDNDTKRLKALALTDIADVWGIGRRIGKRMKAAGINTALRFANLPREEVARKFNICIERTWLELNGVACIEIEHETGTKQQMCCSRSFGEMITEYNQLESAIASFVSTAAQRLRREGDCAGSVSVFIRTNGFREDLEQYYSAATESSDEATSDTLTLAGLAIKALKSIYRPGFFYKKAGVILSDIIPADKIQHSLFIDSTDRERRNRLMKVIDKLNASHPDISRVRLASDKDVSRLFNREMTTCMFSSHIDDIIDITSNDNDN